MRVKHSPGPWKADIAKEQCPIVSDANGHPICELWSSTQTITYLAQEEQDANARLMAKAPSLFWASIRALGYLEALSVTFSRESVVESLCHDLRSALFGLRWEDAEEEK